MSARADTVPLAAARRRRVLFAVLAAALVAGSLELAGLALIHLQTPGAAAERARRASLAHGDAAPAATAAAASAGVGAAIVPHPYLGFVDGPEE